MIWLWYFIAAWGMGLVFSRVVFWFRENRPENEKLIKRFGGAAVILAFVLNIILNPELEITPQFGAILLGSFLILFFGLADDRRSFSWKKQLAFQFFLGLLLVGFGFRVDYITNPWGDMIRLDGWMVDFGPGSFSVGGSFLIIIWVVAIVNAVNWSDGINGLAGAIGILSSLALILVSLRPEVNQPAIAIGALILAGALLGFWWLNFPRGLVELGSSGSYFLAFCLASLAIVSGTKIATALIILAVPVVDAGWVIFERFRLNLPLTQREPNQRHLHYKLRSLGWSDQKIVLAYSVFLLTMLFFSLFISSYFWKSLLLILEFSLILIFVYCIRERKI